MKAEEGVPEDVDPRFVKVGRNYDGRPFRVIVGFFHQALKRRVISWADRDPNIRTDAAGPTVNYVATPIGIFALIVFEFAPFESIVRQVGFSR